MTRILAQDISGGAARFNNPLRPSGHFRPGSAAVAGRRSGVQQTRINDVRCYDSSRTRVPWTLEELGTNVLQPGFCTSQTRHVGLP
jgi:hypothetical protein